VRIDARQGVRGVLIDRGTGRRIPLARWYDPETGEYEAFAEGPGGTVRLDDKGQPVIVRGRAVGRLELVPQGSAWSPPKPPAPTVTPPAEGLVQYQRVYFEVWNRRGEARKCIQGRWREFLQKNDFLDTFVIRRKG
jgi:hypothetical protein